jgi:transaldolase
MKVNPLKQLEDFGQSVWMDYIRRDLITGSEFQRLILEDGLKGITSNPNIFEKAIAESDFYDQDIGKLYAEGKNAVEIYESITRWDIQKAADELFKVYQETDGIDGYVSIEVNPHLAHDTSGTVKEAQRLWKTISRPNIFIKVPATAEGIPAIQQLISEGINVNVTLLFSLDRYAQVANAYINGIGVRLKKGLDVKNVASVASFFVSRIDTILDPMEDNFLANCGEQAHFAAEIRGKVAVASAKIAYKMYNEMFGSEQFLKFAEKNARPQRLLWASTSTKNKSYSDVKYIEELIGSNTVNTMTIETLDAYRDHGNPKARLELNVENAENTLKEVRELHININIVTAKLLDEGIEKFTVAYDKLIEAITKKTSVLSIK